MAGVWEFLTGGASGAAQGAATGLIDGIGKAAVNLRTAITGDLPPELRVQLETHIADVELELSKAQNAVNLAEAQNGNLFVSGWRPALGWVCVGALALYYPTRIILGMWFWANTAWGLQTLPPMPEMGIGDILGLVATLLGSAGLRTLEKVKDVHGEH